MRVGFIKCQDSVRVLNTSRRRGRAVTSARLVSEGSLVRFTMETYIFILAFLLASRSSQLGESYTNEIKHDIHPE